MAQVLKARQAPAALPRAHALLRRATHRLHVRIDKTSVLAALLRPGVTLAMYQTAMQGMKRAFEEIDSVLLQTAALCPKGVPPYLARLPSLERDLMAMDAPLDPPGGTRPATELKVPETAAAYLGIRYVVEGAQLGGRFIYGQLCCTFGAGVDEFGTFWIPEAYTERCWPSVLNSVARVESRDALASCVRTARLTFQHIELCLRGNESEAV
jgi:heme oxygenase